MNKRHTELAFQYMKDADALLYLTYYQHSFSKADRSFLRKLGLIKDAFSMDKMFFILNAADLAKSPVELQTVEDYVRGEALERRHPKSAPVPCIEQAGASTKNFAVQRLQQAKAGGSTILSKTVWPEQLSKSLLDEGKKLCETVFQAPRFTAPFR